MALALREVKPKNARSKRYLDHKAPRNVENPRTTLFLRYTTASDIQGLIQKDLAHLKQPFTLQFHKKNSIYPFEDPSSLEFFADKNDASLAVFSSSTKKRPSAMTFIRFFDHKLLDMLELLLDEQTARTASQFKNEKPAYGVKPMLAFSGSAFESPTANAYTLAKSIFLDMFKGEDAPNVDVEGLRFLIQFSVDEEQDDVVKPQIHMRCYTIRTTKSATTSLPKVHVEEVGPRADWRIGRMREADPDMWKAAMRRPKNLEAKTKKNVETDVIGDKVGRIHMGKQDLSQLQTRKMKGLKRSRDDGDAENALPDADEATPQGKADLETSKRVRVAA